MKMPTVLWAAFSMRGTALTVLPACSSGSNLIVGVWAGRTIKAVLDSVCSSEDEDARAQRCSMMLQG